MYGKIKWYKWRYFNYRERKEMLKFEYADEIKDEMVCQNSIF